MDEQKYKRACEIKQELSVLRSHRSDLVKARFPEGPFELTFRLNHNQPEVKLISKLIPPDFKAVYYRLLDFAIEELEKEFKDL